MANMIITSVFARVRSAGGNGRHIGRSAPILL